MNETTCTKIVDNTEQSYEMGRFLAIIRQMEAELQLNGLDRHPNRIDEAIPFFIEQPSEALDKSQIQLIQSQKLVKEVGKPQLLEEIREVFQLIDVPFLADITLHAENFMQGFREQCQSYQ